MWKMHEPFAACTHLPVLGAPSASFEAVSSEAGEALFHEHVADLAAGSYGVEDLQRQASTFLKAAPQHIVLRWQDGSNLTMTDVLQVPSRTSTSGYPQILEATVDVELHQWYTAFTGLVEFYGSPELLKTGKQMDDDIIINERHCLSLHEWTARRLEHAPERIKQDRLVMRAATQIGPQFAHFAHADIEDSLWHGFKPPRTSAPSVDVHANTGSESSNHEEGRHDAAVFNSQSSSLARLESHAQISNSLDGNETFFIPQCGEIGAQSAAVRSFLASQPSKDAYRAWTKFPAAFRDNEDIVVAAVQVNPEHFECASSRLLGDAQFILETLLPVGGAQIYLSARYTVQNNFSWTTRFLLKADEMYERVELEMARNRIEDAAAWSAGSGQQPPAAQDFLLERLGAHPGDREPHDTSLNRRDTCGGVLAAYNHWDRSDKHCRAVARFAVERGLSICSLSKYWDLWRILDHDEFEYGEEDLVTEIEFRVGLDKEIEEDLHMLAEVERLYDLYKKLKLRMFLDTTITDVVNQLEDWKQMPADGNDFEAFLALLERRGLRAARPEVPEETAAP